MSARPLEDFRKPPIASAPFEAAVAAPFWRGSRLGPLLAGRWRVEPGREQLARALAVDSRAVLREERASPWRYRRRRRQVPSARAAGACACARPVWGRRDSLRMVTAASPVPSCVRSLLEVVDVGLRVGARPSRGSAFSSSGVNARSACWMRFPSWPRTSAGMSFGVCVTKKTPTPFDRISRRVCTTDSTNALLDPSNRRWASSRKKTSFGLSRVSDLGKALEELGDEPHEHGRPQAGPVLHGRQLEAGDDAAPVGGGAQEIGDVELGLAEELGAPARLERDERAQEHADRLRGEAADPLQLLAGPPSESRNVRSARRSDRSRSGRPFSSA